MSHKDKPYRVYRGGREKGPVGGPPDTGRNGGTAVRTLEPETRRPGGAPPPGRGPLVAEPPPAQPPAPPIGPPVPSPEPARPRRRGRRTVVRVSLLVLLLLLALAGWGAFGYFSFRGGVEEANARLSDSAAGALSPQTGSLLSTPSNILVLGVDHGASRDDGDPGRSDSMILIRTDPGEHRIAYLSIPRDLRVDIPGQGYNKINAAYAIGGTALAVRTVEDLIGQPVNHVAVVDFGSFPEVVDALGGITIDVPNPIQSNRFDCPYGSRAECERWQGWRFAKGEQTMDGRRALVYARIRENQLDPSESDLTRAARQQQVIRAISDEIVSPLGFLRLPFMGNDLVTPLATDLSASQLLQLGWVKFRASDDQTLRCRLGGEPATIDEGGTEAFYLIGDEENIEVVSMVLGQSAPQPPPPGQPFAAGCRVGS